jgi:GTP cyclohydrolase I
MGSNEPVGLGENAVYSLLKAIGENPDREGLLDTPRRVLHAWQNEWGVGYHMDPTKILKTFEDGAEKVDEMVVVKDIDLYSHCEHHMAPFFGVAHIAYVPNGKIVGLSKLNRLVECFSRRLQVQERITNQIADALQDHLKPEGVAVLIKAKHMCVCSRGIRHTNSSTVTSALRGCFKDNSDSSRAEFLALCR